MVRIGKNLSFACSMTDSQVKTLQDFYANYNITMIQDYGHSVTVTTTDTNTTSVWATMTTSAVKTLLKPGETYTLSYTTTYNVSESFPYSARAKLVDGTYVNFGNCSKKSGSFTFIMPENVQTIYLLVRLNAPGTTTYSNIMLERGNIATVYEPYQKNETIIVNQIFGGETRSNALEQFTYQEITNSDNFSYAVNTIHNYDLSSLNCIGLLDSIYYKWTNSNPNYAYGPIMKWELVYDDDTVITLGTEDWAANQNSTHISNLHYRPDNQYNKKLKYLRGTRTGTHSGTNSAAAFGFTNFKIGIIKIANT